MALYILLIFALLRPITIGIVQYIPFILELFAVTFSLLFIIIICANLRNIKYDNIDIIIFIYYFYCGLSILWGSSYREVCRFILPILLFYVVRITITDINAIKALLTSFILGYSFLILGSTFLIISGRSESIIVYHSGIERFQGMASGQHALAHSMFIFSIIYALFKIYYINTSKILEYILLLLLICSIYCLYKTFTRTALLGLIIFWMILIFGCNKKLFVSLILGALIISFFNYEKIHQVIWQVEPDIGHSENIDHASSGRLTLWSHNLYIFSQLTIVEKMLGIGIGNEGTQIKELQNITAFSHNDYLTLLMTTGIIGLLLYLLIIYNFIIHVTTLYLEYKVKYIFISFFVSVCIMNFFSNSYINRFELGQLFYLFMGLAYQLQSENFQNIR